MSKREHRGRPHTYLLVDRQRIAEIIRQHGVRGTWDALSRRVSLKTLLKIAGEFGIVLKRGRRPRKAA